MAISFKNHRGFFVPKGPQVELSDGSVVDLLEWLDEEGITKAKTISDYNIEYTEPESEYGEKLSFFKMNKNVKVKAPFFPKSNTSDDSSKIDDDNIPF